MDSMYFMNKSTQYLEILEVKTKKGGEFIMAAKETAKQLVEMAGSLIGELSVFQEKGTQASAKRARKLTLDLDKLGKVFRKESVKV